MSELKVRPPEEKSEPKRKRNPRGRRTQEWRPVEGRRAAATKAGRGNPRTGLKTGHYMGWDKSEPERKASGLEGLSYRALAWGGLVGSGPRRVEVEFGLGRR
jgi:hypothetical protein